MTPLFTILIPTIAEREHLFRRLLDVLMPQVEAAHGMVNVVAWRNAGELSIGELRDRLVLDATGEYVAFIDDDDLVVPTYVADIVGALSGRPDHVGFQLEYCVDGVTSEIVDHSLRHRRWHRNVEGRLVRDFTHVDPVRREHAMRGRFSVARRGRAEDRVWVKQVRPFLCTEKYIDRVLYRYLWSAETSAWQRPERVLAPTSPLPIVRSDFFAWHERSV